MMRRAASGRPVVVRARTAVEPLVGAPTDHVGERTVEVASSPATAGTLRAGSGGAGSADPRTTTWRGYEKTPRERLTRDGCRRTGDRCACHGGQAAAERLSGGADGGEQAEA